MLIGFTDIDVCLHTTNTQSMPLIRWWSCSEHAQAQQLRSIEGAIFYQTRCPWERDYVVHDLLADVPHWPLHDFESASELAHAMAHDYFTNRHTKRGRLQRRLDCRHDARHRAVRTPRAHPTI